MPHVHRLIAPLFLLLPVGAALADDAADVRKAVDGLYSSMAESDLEKVARFVPPHGFTEFNTDGTELKRLDLALFKGAFADGFRIEYHVEQQNVRMIDDHSAIVTGYRVGALTFPDGKRMASRNCSSMVWLKHADKWMLEHIHLSNCPVAASGGQATE